MDRFRHILNLVGNKTKDVAELLREKGVQPSAQRVAVAEYVLYTEDHPSADQVFDKVTRKFPMLSRATVYNTLNLFVEKGLLRELALAEGRVVFDPNIARHHHFIDDESGAILDVPWDAIRVSNPSSALEGFEVREYQVVVRGRRAARS
jgi:Fe2+ or Zn2+ uptake regulation protein